MAYDHATFFGKGLVYLLSAWVGSWLAVTGCLRDMTLAEAFKTFPKRTEMGNVRFRPLD